MRRPTFFALGFLLLPAAAFGQTPSTSTDSQTLQALLAEVRQLRQELRASTLAAQRAQILIYHLQVEEMAVERASQRLENATSKRAQLEEKRKQYEAQLKWYEKTRDRLENSAEQKKYDDEIIAVKAQVDAYVSEEQEMQSKEVELREQLRTEEAKLGRLQDELDRMEKALENASQNSGSKPQ